MCAIPRFSTVRHIVADGVVLEFVPAARCKMECRSRLPTEWQTLPADHLVDCFRCDPLAALSHVLVHRISKWNPIWFEGQAIHNVINWDLLARPSSKFLLAYPELLKILSWATLWGELVLPCLLFIPFKTSWFRGLNIVFYFAFHLGIVFTVSVGLFSAISMAVWLLFIPRGFWNSGIVRSIAGGIFGSSNLLDEESELRPESDGHRNWDAWCTSLPKLTSP